MKHSEIPARNAAILDALNRGVSLEAVAGRWRLNTAYVARLAHETATKQGASVADLRLRRTRRASPFAARDAEIVRRAAGGEDFTSIGRSFDLTRERIRQIVERDLGKSGMDLAAERRAARTETREQNALALAAEEPDASCAEIAARTGLTGGQVESLLGVAEAARRRPTVNPVTATPTADMLAALRRVAALPGGQPLSGPFYDAHRGGAVTSTRIIQVFETWKAACAAAGVVPRPPVRTDYSRRWDRVTCLGYVADYLTSCAEPPSFERFQTWLRAQEGAPSAGTVRLRCGKWIDTVRAAYALVEDEQQSA